MAVKRAKTIVNIIQLHSLPLDAALICWPVLFERLKSASPFLTTPINRPKGATKLQPKNKSNKNGMGKKENRVNAFHLLLETNYVSREHEFSLDFPLQFYALNDRPFNTNYYFHHLFNEF